MNLFLKDGIWWVELQERDFVRRRSTFETSKNRAREVARMLALRPYTGEGVARLREMCLGDVINRYVDMVLLTKRRKLNEDLRKAARNDLLRLRRIEEFFGRRERIANVAKLRSIADFNYSLIHEMKPGSSTAISRYCGRCYSRPTNGACFVSARSSTRPRRSGSGSPIPTFNPNLPSGP